MKTVEYYEKVIVLNCGGTIDMNKSKDVGVSSVSNVIANIQDLMKYYEVDFEYENVFEISPDSSNIGHDEWDIVLKKILNIISDKKAVREKLKQENDYPINKSVGGVVISHGTDTLHLTSLVLALRLSLDSLFFPIIFTGSFTTIDDDNNDIENNLVKSIFAAKPLLNNVLSNKLAPQIYALIGNEVHLATRITKVYTTQNTEGKYFFSYPFPVARITSKTPIKRILQKLNRREENKIFINDISNRIKIEINFDNDYFDSLLNTNSSSDWKLAKQFLYEKNTWQQVEYIVVNKNLNKETLLDLLYRIRDKFLQIPNARYGVVLQGNFSNRSDFEDLKLLIETISSNNVIIMVGSKLVYDKLYHCKYIGLIHKSLSYHKARMKLSFLLKLNLSLSKIIEFMNENIAGEIAEYEKFPDWIQYENYVEEAEIIPIYPNISSQVFKHAVLRNLLKNKNSNIYLYGFGNGHIPSITKPISSIVVGFLNSNPELEFETLFSWNETNDLAEIVNSVSEIVLDNVEIIKKYIEQKYEFCPNNRLGIPQEEMNVIINTESTKFAKRIIKDSLMAENEILNILGEAIDLGLKIHIKTSARSLTNHSDYPVGRVLLAIGVNSDEIDGWDFKNFKTKESILLNKI